MALTQLSWLKLTKKERRGTNSYNIEENHTTTVSGWCCCCCLLVHVHVTAGLSQKNRVYSSLDAYLKSLKLGLSRLIFHGDEDKSSLSPSDGSLAHLAAAQHTRNYWYTIEKLCKHRNFTKTHKMNGRTSQNAKSYLPHRYKKNTI